MAKTIDLQSTITCPECGRQETETMPTDACQWYYECKYCKTLLRPKPGDCCVFCSYGDVPCPPVQDGGRNHCCGPETGELDSDVEERYMKNIKVLGSGCRNCDTTANLIKLAASQAGVEIELEKVTDMAQIMSYGVMSTPGVVVDGELVHAGGLPGPDQVRQWVSE